MDPAPALTPVLAELFARVSASRARGAAIGAFSGGAGDTTVLSCCSHTLLPLLGSRGALALRATCSEARRAVAREPWDEPNTPIYNLARWRACCPAARTACVEVHALRGDERWGALAGVGVVRLVGGASEELAAVVGSALPRARVQWRVNVSTVAGSGARGAADGVGRAATFDGPNSVCVDAAGNIFVSDFIRNRIRCISPAGVVSTLAGSGARGAADGVGAAASFWGPAGLCVNAAGSIIVADCNGHKIRCVTPAGVVSTLAGSGAEGTADGLSSAAAFSTPYDVCVDAAGNVLVADMGHRIRCITPAGLVSTLAGSGAQGDADGSVASFRYPSGVCADAAGNILVADYYNNKIRRISPAGVVSTVAGSGARGAADGVRATFNGPRGLCVDAAGSIIVADSQNNLIRRISCAGVVSTLAGLSGVPGAADGAGAAATFHHPLDVCLDPAGSIVVADNGSNRVRRISYEW
jgi:sugar lactone lactonase YvrE